MCFAHRKHRNLALYTILGLWSQKSMLGFELTKISKQLHANSNHKSLLGSAATIVILVCLFLYFRRPNLIIGLSRWRAPDQPLRTQEPVPDLRTGALPYLWQTRADPSQVGKTDHNVGGLACILGLTNPHNQSLSLPRNIASRDQWCPHQGRKGTK